jgi:hypothetical protein
MSSKILSDLSGQSVRDTSRAFAVGWRAGPGIGTEEKSKPAPFENHKGLRHPLNARKGLSTHRGPSREGYALEEYEYLDRHYAASSFLGGAIATPNQLKTNRQ